MTNTRSIVGLLAGLLFVPSSALADDGWETTPVDVRRFFQPVSGAPMVELGGPADSHQVRLVFGFVVTDTGTALVLEDGEGHEIERISGVRVGYVSSAADGRRVRVRVVGDGSPIGVAFRIVALQYRRCVRTNVPEQPSPWDPEPICGISTSP